MGKVIFEHNGEEHEVADGEPIISVCEEAGVPFACTEGVCGTCIVSVLPEDQVNLSPYTEAEVDFLGEQGADRLACQCRLLHGSIRIKF